MSGYRTVPSRVTHLVGAEVAGELADYSSQQKTTNSLKVTLVQSGGQLCPEMNLKAATQVQNKLEAAGVRVILNDRLIDKDGQKVLKSSGEVIAAMTFGVSPMNSFVDASLLNDKGWVKVDEFYQVAGAPALFAMGDCDSNSEMAGNFIMSNIDVIGHNIKAVLDAKGSDKPPVFKKQAEAFHVYVCTTGTKGGVASTPWINSTWLLPFLKNKTMFFSTPQGKYGLEH